MKNILIIHHGTGVGGGLIALLGLIDELKKQNKVVVFSVFDGVAVSYLRKTGVKVITPNSTFYQKFYSIFIHSEASYLGVIEQILKVKSLLFYFINKYYFSFNELKKSLKNVDLVYLNSTFISDWAYAAKKANKKVIIHVREPISRNFIGYKIIKHNISKYCDKVIAISKDNSYRLNLKNKTTIIYDPVVFKNRNNKINEIQTNKKYKYFVYVGGESRIKGFEQLVMSLDYLNDDIKIFFLGSKVIYNNIPLKRFLRRFINPFAFKHEKLQKKLEFSNKIIRIGLTDDVFSYFKKSRFLISPFSKPHTSLPVLEAFSYGLPVIVSNVEGMDEVVTEKNGLFFKNKNYKHLASKINEASLISYEEYQLLKFNAKKTFNKIKENEIKVQFIISSLLQK